MKIEGLAGLGCCLGTCQSLCPQRTGQGTLCCCLPLSSSLPRKLLSFELLKNRSFIRLRTSNVVLSPNRELVGLILKIKVATSRLLRLHAHLVQWLVSKLPWPSSEVLKNLLIKRCRGGLLYIQPRHSDPQSDLLLVAGRNPAANCWLWITSPERSSILPKKR